MSEQADGDRADLDPAERAGELEQRYVDEYQGIENLLEGLDPEQQEERPSTDEVRSVAGDRETERDVEAMNRNDP